MSGGADRGSVEPSSEGEGSFRLDECVYVCVRAELFGRCSVKL